jgi:glycosyltransferase involved in cell wall biosynthesis
VSQLPLVSVIIPTYNYGRFVVEAVESALGQTYPNVEVIVVDDGSTDDTQRRIAPYVAGSAVRLLPRAKPPIQLVRQANRGAPAALNRGIQLARGDWIAWLSADDTFLPTKLQEQVAHAAQHPDERLIYTDWYLVDAAGRVTTTVRSLQFASHQQLVRALFGACVINGSTTLIHRTCFERDGMFAEDLPQAHDWDLWLRLARDFRFGYVPKPLVRYRWHDANLSRRSDALAYNSEVLRRARAWYAGKT